MPYTPQHKEKTRRLIIESARILFNRHGFHVVTIDEIMAHAGLTRGGFYNHFRTKEELYAAAVSSFLNGRGKAWRDEAGVDPFNGGLETVRAMLDSYLSPEHLDDIDGQCPMIALSSDVARSTPQVRDAYEDLLNAMIWLFEHNLPDQDHDKHKIAMTLAALSVGGMILSRTISTPQLAHDIRQAAHESAQRLLSANIQD